MEKPNARNVNIEITKHERAQPNPIIEPDYVAHLCSNGNVVRGYPSMLCSLCVRVDDDTNLTIHQVVAMLGQWIYCHKKQPDKEGPYEVSRNYYAEFTEITYAGWNGKSWSDDGVYAWREISKPAEMPEGKK